MLDQFYRTSGIGGFGNTYNKNLNIDDDEDDEEDEN